VESLSPNKDSHPLESGPDFLPADAAVSVHVQSGKHKSEHEKYILQYSSHIGSVHVCSTVSYLLQGNAALIICSLSKPSCQEDERERYWRVRDYTGKDWRGRVWKNYSFSQTGVFCGFSLKERSSEDATGGERASGATFCLLMSLQRQISAALPKKPLVIYIFKEYVRVGTVTVLSHFASSCKKTHLPSPWYVWGTPSQTRRRYP
jgi:hypothetical protein